jgi:hypothetical protein
MKVEPFALVTNSALNASKAKVRDARSYVENMLTSASDVVIVSGYYGEDFIRTILSATKGTAKKRILKFVFAGLPDVAREEQVENLIRLRGDIVKATRCAQKNIDILLSLDIRFLHAKVFRFRSKNKPPMYLIGSANFSNSAFAQNDEAMVVIKGVHPGLQDYIEHVLRTSTSIEKLPPETAARTWRDFLRNAYLYYRPSRAVSFAIDPFKDEEFRDIAKRLRETIFNPLPFGERNVLGLNIAALLQLEIPENTRVGFRMPTYSIETDYGYWVPKAYVDFIDEMLEESLGPRLRALEQRGLELQQAGDKFVSGQINLYLDEVARRIGSGNRPLTLAKRHRDAISEKIRLRVRHLTTTLTHRKSLERLRTQAMVERAGAQGGLRQNKAKQISARL